MGLTISIKGLDDKESYNCGYITFGIFRQEISKLVSVEFGDMYRKMYQNSRGMTDEDWTFLEQNCPAEIGPFLFHCDCDGKLTPKECRSAYSWLKDKKMDMIGHNYIYMEPYNMLEHWLKMFKFCADRRVNMYFE